MSAAQSRRLLTIHTDGDATADPVLMSTSVVSSVSFKNPPCIKPPESHGERALGNMQYVSSNKLVRVRVFDIKIKQIQILLEHLVQSSVKTTSFAYNCV